MDGEIRITDPRLTILEAPTSLKFKDQFLNVNMLTRSSSTFEPNKEGVAKVGVRALINQVYRHALRDNTIDYATFYDRFQAVLQEELARHNFEDKVSFIASCLEGVLRDIQRQRTTLLYFPDKHHESYGAEKLAQIEEWMISVRRDFFSGTFLILTGSGEPTEGSEEP